MSFSHLSPPQRESGRSAESETQHDNRETDFCTPQRLSFTSAASKSSQRSRKSKSSRQSNSSQRYAWEEPEEVSHNGSGNGSGSSSSSNARNPNYTSASGPVDLVSGASPQTEADATALADDQASLSPDPTTIRKDPTQEDPTQNLTSGSQNLTFNSLNISGVSHHQEHASDTAAIPSENADVDNKYNLLQWQSPDDPRKKKSSKKSGRGETPKSQKKLIPADRDRNRDHNYDDRSNSRNFNHNNRNLDPNNRHFDYHDYNDYEFSESPSTSRTNRTTPSTATSTTSSNPNGYKLPKGKKGYYYLNIVSQLRKKQRGKEGQHWGKGGQQGGREGPGGNRVGNRGGNRGPNLGRRKSGVSTASYDTSGVEWNTPVFDYDYDSPERNKISNSDNFNSMVSESPGLVGADSPGVVGVKSPAYSKSADSPENTIKFSTPAKKGKKHFHNSSTKSGGQKNNFHNSSKFNFARTCSSTISEWGNWEERRDTEGNCYFYNVITGETTDPVGGLGESVGRSSLSKLK
jgi:hypothetical protein